MQAGDKDLSKYFTIFYCITMLVILGGCRFGFKESSGEK
jgi:hypothetical protein